MIPSGRLVLVLLLASLAPVAAAQDPGPGMDRDQATLAAGLILTGGYAVGDRSAQIRQNATGTPAPFTLFRAESAFEGAKGIEARVGLVVSRALVFELGAAYAKTRLATTITGDAEATDAAIVGEDVSHYVVDVSGIYQLPRVTLGPRARPYVVAGAGYLRQLHEDRLLVETGQIISVGGGVRYWLRGGSAGSRALGVRADVRVVHRLGGVDFEEKRRSYPAFSLLGFAGF